MAGEGGKDDRVVFLAFRNEKVTEDDRVSFVTCSACQNKTYTLVADGAEFPMLRCAACGAHIGRVGWTEA